jgi:hypothetical protein
MLLRAAVYWSPSKVSAEIISGYESRSMIMQHECRMYPDRIPDDAQTTQLQMRIIII